MSCELLFSSEEQQEEASKEENEGEGSYPAEEFCPPGDVAFDLGFYYSHFIRDAVVLHLIDRVSKELVAVFGIGFPNQQGVARAVELAVIENKDAVVLYIAQIEGVGMNLANELSGLLCASAPDEGAEGEKRKDK